MAIFTCKSTVLRKVAKILLGVLLFLLALFCLTVAFVQTEWGQNWLAHKVTDKLSADLKSRISIKKVQIQFFNKMNLQGVFIEDLQKDTLLAAGTVQVRITDWFFLKDKAVLHYIGLENAVINLNRTDSVWNYHFLEEYFASPGSNKKKSGIEFNLEEAVLRNVAFNQRDAWRGENIIASVGELNLDANDLSVTQKNIDIDRLELVDPFFQLYSYTGNRPEQPAKAKSKDAPPTGLQWNTADWRMVINTLTVKNGTFKNDQKTIIPTTQYFDGAHVAFEKIHGEIKKFTLSGDTARANINLAAKERSGLDVQRFKTAFRLHPQLMEFANLYLKTDKSVLGNYLSMKYKSMADLNDFIHAVRLDANFNKSTIASDDIALFAPDIKDWNRSITIDGKVRGTIDALDGKNVSLGIGRNTSLFGDFSLIGLPDVKSTFINVKANSLRTTYADAATFIPAIKTITMPNLKGLGNVVFTGTYTGFINDFVTYGTLQTNLGTVKADLNVKLPRNAEPVYSGNLATNNFQLGSFINNKQLGLVAFTGYVKGSSFAWNKLDMNINGQIKKFYFNGYTYQNITAKGRLKNRVFDGNFVIKDPNADLSLTGLIDLKGVAPLFDVKANITRLDLQALNLSRDGIAIAGDFNLNFRGRSIEDFLGNAKFNNISFTQNGKVITLDSLQVSSVYTNGIRTLKASSTAFNATVTGNFDLKTLPEAVTRFLSVYYPSYIRAPRYAVANQSFTFDITTHIVEDYVSLLDKRFTGFNNSRITGSLNVDSSRLLLNAQVPQFAFQQYQFSDIKINGDGNYDRLVLNGQVSKALVSDSLNFPQTTFAITARNDVSDVVINTTANKTLNKADLSAQIKTFSDGASVFFNPSSFVLNGKTWSIEQGGALDFRKNTVLQGQLVVKESNQEIRISTQPSSIGDWTDLHVSLQSLNIGDFTPFFVKSNRIEGLLYGDILIENPQNRLNVIAENIRTEQLRIDEDSIGQVLASLNYNNSSGMFTATGNNADPQHAITFDIVMDFKDTANTFQDRISAHAENYPAKILERFLGTLFSDMQGFLTGDLDIVGEGANRQYLARANVRNAGLKVNFTQVFYKLDDTEIILTKDAIELGTIKLRDRLNNTATLQGTIKHEGFKNMEFDIAVEVDREPMELINTTYKDNQQFYGRAMGTGSFVLVGPQNDMFMQINAKASDRDSSYLTLPPSVSRESGTASFMVEKKYGTEMTEEAYSGAETNITYEVNLAANPLVNMEVILDDLTGDIIKGRGVGNLHLRAGTSEPLSMRGRYDIQDGSYLFTFQSFFKKPFVLRKGANNFIQWNGDPYTATIHFDAAYEANAVSLSPLVSSFNLANNPNTNRALANARGDVTVIATLTGELFRPKLDFKIEFPQNFYNTLDQTTAFTLQQAIQQIEKNTNELNKQVAFLIATNSFAPFDGAQNNTVNPLNEFAYSTISGLIFGEVNKRLNQLLSKILRNNDLTVNFTGSLYNSSLINNNSRSILPNQSNLNLSIGKPLLNERVLISLGSTFDIPLQSSIQRNVQLFPDVTVEFLINKSGTVRATFFYRQTPDFLTATNSGNIGGAQRAGANLAYTREFNSLKSIFLGKTKGRRKEKKEKKPEAEAVESTSTTGNR